MEGIEEDEAESLAEVVGEVKTGREERTANIEGAYILAPGSYVGVAVGQDRSSLDRPNR